VVELVTCRAGNPALLVLVAAAGLSAAMAGCSSSSTPATGNTATASPPATANTGAGTNTQAAGASVTVDEKEYSLTLSRTAFTPGTYTFVATDVGTVVHALAIAGPGVATTQTSPINPGSSANLTVTLKPGGYELWCPIDDHKALGMDTHIVVAAAAAPTASTSTSAAHMVQ
jgi:uncharacterized cupredoxin-like copper-binding protein